jgi:hypothetical protein
MTVRVPRPCLSQFVALLIALSQLVAARASGAATVVPGGAITTAVSWSLAGSPYVVQGVPTIAGSGAVTIAAGVEVRFTPGSWIEVQSGGALTANGAAGQQVTFTSDAAAPQPGDWYHVDALAGSHVRLTYCDLRYGGRNGNPALRLRAADAQLHNCSVRDFPGTGIQLEGGSITPVIADTTVTTATGWAIYQNTLNMAPQYSHVTLAGGGVNGVVIDGDTVSGAIILDGSPARFTGGAPIIMRAPTIVPSGATLTIAPGTGVRTPIGGSFEVRDGGTLVAEGSATSPIVIRADTAAPAPGDWYYIAAQSGAHLRLAYCDLGYGGRNTNPALLLRASDVQIRNCTLHHFPATGIQLEGAGIAPVIADSIVTTMTGWAIYQNTMNMAPQWSNLTMTGGGTNALVVDGNTVSGAVTLDGTAARFVGGAPVIMRNPTIVPAGATLTVTAGTEVRTPLGGSFEVRDGGTLVAEGGVTSPIVIRADTATPTPGDWYYIAAQSGAHLRLSHCDLGYGGRNGNPALILRGSDAELRYCTIHHFAATGISVEGAGIAPVIANTSVTTTSGWAIYQNTINMAPQYSLVTLAGTGTNALVVDGSSVSGAVTLSGNAARFTGRKPVILLAPTSIPAGATLTVAAGTELRTPIGGAFTIANGGTLVAEGTATAPVTFRASTATAAAGDWYNVDAQAGSHLRLKYCDIGYGGRNGNPALLVRTSDATIANATIHHGGATGLQIEGAGVAPAISATRIENHAGWAIYQNTINMAPTYAGVSLTGNGHDALLVDGDTVTTPVVLDPAGIGGKPIQLAHPLAIQTGASLTVAAGTQLRFPLGWSVEVRSGATLAVTGTPSARVTFQAETPAPSAGDWYYVDALAGSHLRLANADLRWGGRNGNPTLRVRTSDAIVSGCTVRDSIGDGVWVADDAALRVSENQVLGNGFGIHNWNAKSWVDARFVWWGDSSGPYHAALNPAGKGNAVSDKVLFEPWLVDETGTLSSSYVVQVRGPSRAVSGETVDFSIYWATYADLKDAVLAVTLPFTADYVPQAADAVYQPGLRQVFWRLGDLPAGSEGEVPLRVRHGFGIPNGLLDEVDGFLFGSNQSTASETVDVAPYAGYTALTPTAHRTLSPAEVSAAVAGSAQLKTFVDQAADANYLLLGGSDIALSNGDAFVELVLVDRDRHGAMFLRRRAADGHVIRSVVTPTEYAIGDTSGGLVATVPNGPIAYWGTWAGAPSAAEVRAMATDPFLGCLRNCIYENLGMYALGKISKTVDQAMQVKDCVQAVLSSGGNADAVANCAVNLGSIAVEKLAMVKDEVQLLYPCVVDCSADTTTHYCRQSIIIPNPSPEQSSWLAPAFTDPARNYSFFRCDPETRMLESPVTRACPPGYQPVANYWNRNITPPGPCLEVGLDKAVADLYKDIDRRQQVGARMMGFGRTRMTMRRAKDPNEKYGPKGDVLAGERLSYTVTCENVGDGTAYGVFILDQLHANLDESTLEIQGGGTFIPAARSIIWDVGELAPKGQPGSTGSVSFSVAARAGLAPGATIPNRAVVYFPSVPEETPTNWVVNTVGTVAAHPQELETAYQTPLAIALAGSPATSAPLTYAITRQPSFGAVTGTPPYLTYTPASGFTGVDYLSFTAAGATATSEPAQVQIAVAPPAHDTTPPQVTWVWPAAGQTLTNVGLRPTGGDEDGPLYAPFILAEASEGIAPESVTVSAVTVVDREGRRVPVGVTLDSARNRIVISLRERWRATTYTVAVTAAIKDLAGNPLAATRTWSFAANPPSLVRERVHPLE